MKKTFLLVVCLAFTAIGLHAQTDSQAETQHYIEVIRQHIFKEYKGMFKPPKGYLKYPFITPGCSSYQDQLWDWDSWLTDIALRQILLENGSSADKKEALKYEEGCVLNFLNSIQSGRIPVVISPNNKDIMDTGPGFLPLQHNMHKPCLAQHAAFLVKLNGGNAEWLRDEFPRLQAFVDCYYNHYREMDEFASGVALVFRAGIYAQEDHPVARSLGRRISEPFMGVPSGGRADPQFCF